MEGSDARVSVATTAIIPNTVGIIIIFSVLTALHGINEGMGSYR